ncbi:MAG: hypothetical protein ACOC8F_04175, partial [Planctomycetota bacterium]
GIFGPMLGGALGDLGNFPLAFSICGGLVLAAALLIAILRHPHPPMAEPAVELAAEAEAETGAAETDQGGSGAPGAGPSESRS